MQIETTCDPDASALLSFVTVPHSVEGTYYTGAL